MIAFGRGRKRFQRLVDRRLQFGLDFFLQLVDALLVEDAFAQQEHLRARDRIALGVALALGVGPVEPLIIRERM